MIDLKNMLEYLNYKDGNLYWKLSPSPRVAIGDLAQCLDSKGYYQTKFKGKKYLTHRLIFLFHYSFCPNIIDHIDRNSKNNRIENLRAATKSQNGGNRQKNATNRCNFKGVSMYNNTQQYLARIQIQGKQITLGIFNTKEGAAKAYNQAAIQYFGEFAKVNSLNTDNTEKEFKV